MTVVPRESKQDEPGVLVATLCDQLAVPIKEGGYGGLLNFYRKLPWNRVCLLYTSMRFPFCGRWLGVDHVGSKVIFALQ